MSQGNQNRSNRGRSSGGNQQRRRRGGSRSAQPQAPKGPTMTALGESTYEAVLDHGGNGYGVWFDGMVREDPMYKQFWKGTGNRPLYVRIEENRIVLTKELDREQLPVALDDATTDAGTGADHGDEVEAIDLEADAKKAGAAAETVYTPEEAARLFAGEGADESATATGDAAAAADAEAAADEAPAKPKRRTTRKKAAPKADADAAPDPAADADEKAASAE